MKEELYYMFEEPKKFSSGTLSTKYRVARVEAIAVTQEPRHTGIYEGLYFMLKIVKSQ